MTLDPDVLLQLGQAGSGNGLEEMIIRYDLSEAQPIVLNIILGNHENKRERLVDVVRRLSSFRSFKLIVFLDQGRHVKAFMQSWAAFKLLSDVDQGEKFVSAINEHNIDQLNAIVDHLVTKPLSVQDSNAEALRWMTRTDFEAFAVVDSYFRLKDVVERDDVVAKMMLALVNT
jgi:hypothetical protein